MELILASASPRRKEICERLGLTFTVIPAQSEPSPDPSLSPSDAVLRVAQAKAREIAAQYPHATVLGADTAVCATVDGAETLLGKPHSEAEAASMLRALQGTTHRVITAVWLCRPAGETGCACETVVTFYPMSDDEIAAYIATGEPMDKAGAYGIQGYGMRYIREIQGDYYTVMGLPAAKVWQLLHQNGQN